MYIFTAYHILEGVYYINDFEGGEALYNTATRYPVQIDGQGLTMKINETAEVFDTLVSEGDTSLIDYIEFNIDQSNNQAVNGAVHLINRVMEPFLPDRIEVVNQFYNEPVINLIRNVPGETRFRSQEDFTVMAWTGAEELTYVKSSEPINGVWNNDYIILEGAFAFSYEIPRILPGKYNLFVAAHALSNENASINLKFDGNSIGGSIDLTSGGTDNNPYYNFLVGTVELDEYSTHVIEVSTLIPGVFKCDRFTLQPLE